jgi:hypothetical protein
VVSQASQRREVYEAASVVSQASQRHGVYEAGSAVSQASQRHGVYEAGSAVSQASQRREVYEAVAVASRASPRRGAQSREFPMAMPGTEASLWFAGYQPTGPMPWVSAAPAQLRSPHLHTNRDHGPAGGRSSQ